MRAQSPNSNLPRQTRRRFGRNLASSPFSSFMFVTEPLPRIPVFQQRIKIPRPPPPRPRRYQPRLRTPPGLARTTAGTLDSGSGPDFARRCENRVRGGRGC